LKAGVGQLRHPTRRTDKKMTFMKFTSLCAGSLVLACLALSQDVSHIAFPKRPFKHDGQFITQYDAKENTTFVFLEPVFIDAAKISLRLAASFEYDGRTPTKPRHISFSFYALYPDCKFSSSKVTMKLDGKLLRFGTSFKSFRERKPDEEGVAFRFDEIEGEKCSDSLAMFISQRNFLRLVNANDVEVQIGAFEFKLTEANLEALRDLASRMVK
jgi:hypothetical protein